MRQDIQLHAAIRSVWTDLLGYTEEIGGDDNFFEVGGNSLMALRFIARMDADMGIKISFREIFQYPTSHKLSSHLEKNKAVPQGSGISIGGKNGGGKSGRYPLSYGQERLWVIDRLNGSVEYHIPLILRVHGIPDQEALRLAIKQLAERHQVLRSVIRSEGQSLFQEAIDPDRIEIGIVDKRQEVFDKEHEHSDNELLRKEVLHKEITEIVMRPFVLSAEPPFRVSLFLLPSEESILVIVLHHIAADGWSLSILIKELSLLYLNNTGQESHELPVLDIQYVDYAGWQRGLQGTTAWDQGLSYWKQKLSHAIPAVIRTDHPRPVVPGIKGQILSFDLDREVIGAAKTLAIQHGTSLYMVLLTAFNALLYRYTGQDDICIGTPASSRTKKEMEGLIGFFVNMLPLRSHIDQRQTFLDLLTQVKTTTLEAYEHQEIPFDQVAVAVNAHKGGKSGPLFEILFTLENAPEAEIGRLGPFDLSVESVQIPVCRYEIAISVAEEREGTKLYICYAGDLYKKETIVRLIDLYQILLRAVVHDPSVRLGSIRLGQGEDRNTQGRMGMGGIITDLLEAQVKKTPDNIALEFDNQRLTYSELAGLSARLAHFLRENGVAEEVPVSLCLNRGINMIVGILAILKAGGAYVPISPDYPRERINDMIGQSDGAIIITERNNRDKISVTGDRRLFVIDDILATTDGVPGASTKRVATPPDTNLKPGNLAYMIYTSGSTGRPKAVMIEHRSLFSLISDQLNYFGIKEDDRILLFSNYCFDASVEQLFLALCSGACLVMFREGMQPDARKFGQFLRSSRITHLHATPSFLESIPEADYQHLRRVVAGGELCRKALAFKWGPGVRFFNEYGPTETTVTAVEFEYLNSDQHKAGTGPGDLPIGRPLPGVLTYVLDEGRNFTPVGLPGELYIGGSLVARGYAGNSVLTEDRFPADPFCNIPGARMYRTGDIVIAGEDGNLHYLGRRDNQVKIRGYRIELEEVENVLLQNDMIKQSAVVARGTDHRRYLVAYILPHSTYNKDVLLTWLRTRLPEYMLPAKLVELDLFPLNQNGKIDRNALPEVNFSDLPSEPYVAPENELERRLVTIWQEVLGIERIGVNDSFFELGGHSLFAMRLIIAMEEELNIHLPGNTLYEQPTIRQLSAFFGERGWLPAKTADGLLEIRI